MKKILFTILCFFCLLPVTQAKEKVDVYLFYGEGCPHCKAEKELFSKMKDSDIEIHELEVWENEENQKFLENVIETMDLSVSGVPVTIIGSSYITGYMEEYEYTIKRMIDTCKKENCKDYVSLIKKGETDVPKAEKVGVSMDDRVQYSIQYSFFDWNNKYLIGALIIAFLYFLFICFKIFRKRRKKQLTNH